MSNATAPRQAAERVLAKCRSPANAGFAAALLQTSRKASDLNLVMVRLR